MKTSFFCVSGKRRLRQRTDAVLGLEEQHHIIRVSLTYRTLFEIRAGGTRFDPNSSEHGFFTDLYS